MFSFALPPSQSIRPTIDLAIPSRPSSTDEARAVPSTRPGHVTRAIFQRHCQICHGADGRGAPLGGQSAGMPALTLPLMNAGSGLPIGVQLVGPRHGDARLLRTARWLARRVEAS